MSDIDASSLALAISALSFLISFLSLGWTVAWSIWLYRQSNRTHLEVKASHALAVIDGTRLLAASVTNDGALPVTIDDVAVIVKGDRQGRRLLPPAWMQGVFPQRLDVGDAVDFPPVPLDSLGRTLHEDMADLVSGTHREWQVSVHVETATDVKFSSNPISVRIAG
jgi:hypothetical protein